MLTLSPHGGFRLCSDALPVTDSRPLFVYGSLLEPAVLHVLLDRVPVHLPAQAPGFAALTFPGKEFPVLAPSPGVTTQGHLLTDLSTSEMALLDAWEHPVYQLTPIEVELAGELVVAFAYTVTELQVKDLGANELWDRAVLTASLQVFLARCADFLAEYKRS